MDPSTVAASIVSLYLHITAHYMTVCLGMHKHKKTEQVAAKLHNDGEPEVVQVPLTFGIEKL